MNILFLDQFSEMGGAQRCLADLLPAVAARGWTAHVAAPGNGPLGTYRLPLSPYRSGRKTLADVMRFRGDLRRVSDAIEWLVRETRADMLYVNGPRILPFVRAGRPVIFHAHSFLNRRYAAALVGSALRRTRATLIANCRYVATPLARHVRATHIVYNGAAPATSAREPYLGPPRIAMIGRISPQKGQAELVRAARLLPEFRFTICGAPLFDDADAHLYERDVRRLAADLPVEFTGWREDIGPVLAATDLLVVPSVQPEATTRVILEAFAARVPVLASNNGGIPEVVAHNQTGFLIESMAAGRLAAQIGNLCRDRARLEEVANRGHDAWRARYTLEIYQRGILSIMETVGPSARR